MDYRRRGSTPTEQPEFLPPRPPNLPERDPVPEYVPEEPEHPSRLTPAGKYALLIGLVLGGAGLTYYVSKVNGHERPPAWKHYTSDGVDSTVSGDSARDGAAVPPGYDSEVRFGIVAPFTGPSKELGREMALGLNTAFAEANTAGGIAGRQVKLVTADDGYEPARTASAMAKLHELDGVIGYVGNVGTPTAAVALPYALGNHMLFFGAFTGAESLRATPPDRYVFNYRPSYAEETEAAVRYLVRVRGIKPAEIAVFAQDDSFGESGFNGVTRALRGLGAANTNATLHMTYARNSLDLKGALATLHSSQRRIKAVVMVASYRPAAKFIEAVRPDNPDMIFTNVSFVGSTALADELKLLGPKYMDNVIVTQTVPSITGYSTVALEYKSELAKFFPGEAPDYVSFEAYVDGKLLLAALQHTGKNPTTEGLVSTLENTHGLELGLGTPLSFSPSEHQASHKIWGTKLTRNGDYAAIDLD